MFVYTLPILINPIIYTILITTIIFRTILVIISSHWLLIWIGFEINLLALGMRRGRVVLMNDWGILLVRWWAAVLIPFLFFSRDLGKCPSCLSRRASLFSTAPGYGGLTKTRSDEFSRIDWYLQESSVCSLEVDWFKSLFLSHCYGCGKSCTGRSNPGQTTSQSHRWHPNKCINKKPYWKDELN